MSAATVIVPALRTGARVLCRAARRSAGLPPRADTADRRLVEQRLLPHYTQRSDIERVLIVGVRWYSAHYPDLLAGKSCHTLDVAPRAARFGARGRHMQADVREVGQLYQAASFDLVLFNGVFGWGLDDAPGLERTLRGFATVLRPGGELVFGWNDTPRRCPFDWRLLAAWRFFAPRALAPFDGQARIELHDTDNRHRFDAFARVAADAAHAC